MKLTAEELERRSACADQVKLFREVFGESAEVNSENAMKAGEAGLDLRWLIFEMEDNVWCEFDKKAYSYRKPRIDLVQQVWDEFWFAHEELFRELHAGNISEREHEEAMRLLRRRLEEDLKEIRRTSKAWVWVLAFLALEKHGLKWENLEERREL